ncbi:DUF4159 domain-containing protein [Methylocella tundrae]|uniref:LytTR family transcriptional regulator n=1 Tax=Methylocella tundrae TaxID=227605 RepID=A0A4U8Z6Y0_METTU|nr:DUF4159 domain-containing protein [Methylocella tundrae]WPP04619.1 DUF4159 domain-containing protein [Methylocella tundrae]VFU11053.1 LytTR family transcriptional regulator [Methylocella tundrae]
MFGIPLAFTVPLALTALIGLPLLYYVLRVTPPRPRQVPFPPLRLFLDLLPANQTPRRTPLWLLILRLAIAACIIFAMAGPVLNPAPVAAGAGPLLLVLDDGWPAAPSWDRRIEAAAQRIQAAGQRSRPVAIVATSDGPREILPFEANKALERLRAIKPAPYAPDRLPALGAIKAFIAAHDESSVVWIADGLERGHAGDFAAGLAGAAKHLSIVTDPNPVRALSGPQNLAGGLEVGVLRSAVAGAEQGEVRALDLKGLAIGAAPFDFAGKTATTARFDLPVELRNDIVRLEIAGEHSAGAVSLLDERWRRRSVGIVSGEAADVSQPLLAPNYYLKKALSPFADVREARPGVGDPIHALLEEHVAVMVLADIGAVSGPTHDELRHFIEDGGILVRFAGTRLANASDDLVPVRLRRGGRVLGGSMSWDTPKKLAPFERSSPFFGLNVPDEVTVTRQVLAEPDPGLPAKTLAQLSDGTPLVTAMRMGKGMTILFHVTADTTWSNLPLSGLFVDMLRKIVDLSGETGQGAATGVEAEKAQTDAAKAGDKDALAASADQPRTVAPTRTLDGYGVLGVPPASAKPIPIGFAGAADAEHLPGFYGPQNAPLAVNTLLAGETLSALDFGRLGLAPNFLRGAEPVDLRPFLIAAAFLLFCLDALASLWLSGALRPSRRAVAGLAAFLIACGCVAGPMRAQAEPSSPAISQRDINSALTTRLAYVVSGDAKVDEASRQGLLSLSRVLARRTSLTPGEPVGVDPARDELSFYPLLYWPIVAGRPRPSQEAIAKISAFMRLGGTIIFDTRDALTARPDGPPTPEAQWLRQLLDGVDVPELAPVPADHVVTKTFYLLDGFVGRYVNGVTWIEALPPAPADGSARPARSGDGVSPVIITSNDLAGGWASDPDGESLYALTPGGARQHELALRGGVNLVMYTLTGNYKADQVHVRDLLERLAH